MTVPARTITHTIFTCSPIMSLRCLVLIPSLLAAVASPAARAAPEPVPIVQGLGLQDYRVTYEDEAGRSISAAQFNQQAEGKSLSVFKDEARKTAVLRLSARPGAWKETPALAVRVGDAMPGLSGTLIDGKPTTLTANSGRYTLLAFFFARCAPCVSEIPELNHLQATRPDVQVVGVTFDPLPTTRMLAAKHGIRDTTLSDAKASIDPLRLQGYPTLLLVKPDGTLAAVKSGGALAGDAASRAALNDWLTRAIDSTARKS